MSPTLSKECLHCTTAANNTHGLKTCGRCEKATCFNATCQKANCPIRKLVCNKVEGSRSDGSVVVQNPTRSTPDEVYEHGAFIPLRTLPSRESPLGKVVLFRSPPDDVEQFANLAAEERTGIEIIAAEDMMEGVHGDVFRERIGGMIDVLRVERALGRWEEVEEERKARIQ